MLKNRKVNHDPMRKLEAHRRAPKATTEDAAPPMRSKIQGM